MFPDAFALVALLLAAPQATLPSLPPQATLPAKAVPDLGTLPVTYPLPPGYWLRTGPNRWEWQPAPAPIPVAVPRPAPLPMRMPAGPALLPGYDCGPTG